MSDVGLSNASPTLERVDARQPDNARAPVRRNLFGAPDREEIQRQLAAVVEEDVQRFRENYNFDPVEDRPLAPGRYEWHEDDEAPDFFRRAPHRREDAEGRQPDRGGSMKRRSGDSGGCSASDVPSKRSHNDGDDDDEEQPGSAAVQAVSAAEESAAEVQ